MCGCLRGRVTGALEQVLDGSGMVARKGNVSNESMFGEERTYHQTRTETSRALSEGDRVDVLGLSGECDTVSDATGPLKRFLRPVSPPPSVA